MKTKYFLFAAVMPLALASCSDEQYLNQANAVGKDNLGELIEAPLLGGGIDGEAQTRVYDNMGKWTWMPEVQEQKAVKVDAIGLCWTGVVNGEEYEGPQKTTSDMVYTNNKFEHAGWLFENEDAPKFHCGDLNNGAYHNYFDGMRPAATYNTGTWSVPGKNLDFGKGVFKSASATIYSGEYIVYSPYNPTFWNAPVTAIQEREMTLTIDNSTTVKDKAELMSKYAFTVGYVPTIKGGDAASQFTTKMLSSGLHFKLKGTSRIIKEIVLWTKGEKGIILEQPLSAQKIKAGIEAGKLTTDVYMERKENGAVSSMVVKLGTNGVTINENEIKDFYVPVLPYEQALKDLNILLVDSEGKTAIINKKNYTFPAGSPQSMTLKFQGEKVQQVRGIEEEVLAEGTFSAVNYAYDEESFWRAYGKAFTAEKNASNEARTVRLLDNVKLETNDQGLYYKDLETLRTLKDVVIDVAEGETAKLILGNENATNIGNGVMAYKYGFRNTTFKVDVEGEARGCCGNGKVNLSLLDCTTAENTTLTLNGGSLFLGNQINFYGNVVSKFEDTDEEGVNHVGKWDRTPLILLSKGAEVNAYAGFRNEGTLKIQKNVSGGKGKATFNLIGGQFVNASTEKADKTQYKATIIVEGEGKVGEDGVLNILNSTAATATLDNYGDIYNHGNIDNDHGKFTNKANASFIDYVGSSLSGDRLVNEDETSEFICEVNSEVRYKAAIDLNGIRPTTTIRFVYGEAANLGNGTFTKEYILKPNKENGIYVPGASGEQLVKFESAIDNKTDNTVNELVLRHATILVGEVQTPVPTTIGSVTVKSGKINVQHEALTIKGNYTADGALNSYFPVGIQKITGDMNLTTSKGNNENEGTGNVLLVKGKKLNVDGNLNAINVAGDLTFNEKSEVNVGGNIVITNVEGATGTSFNKGTLVKAKNLSVATGQKVIFDKNNVTYLGEKGVEGVLTNNGTVNIVNSVSGSDVAAVVWCNGRAGNGTYQNNSKPQYYR